MTDTFASNEFGTLGRVAIKHVRDTFVDQRTIDAEWRALNFSAPPDVERAMREYDHFADLIASSGAEVLMLPRASGVGLDSIYARDASISTPHGMVLGGMGKPARGAEPAAQGAAFEAWGLRVAGAIEAPGTLEGGDLIWLDRRTVVVGRGYRTNDEGIRQLRAMLGDAIEELLVVPLPHWRGPADVFHLMSIISPIDADLAVVYSPLMPVPFREWLSDRGIAFVEVPDEEFDRMGANVLALGPRRCVMVDGCPETRARLERAGAEVHVYRGEEISLKGGGGPTCLTRPIGREESVTP
ncbi:MAG: arginine deiminase family protein [Acidobacteriota bacterium]|nr:arginine deiminase family protein [Acidobacteriota bacterium]